METVSLLPSDNELVNIINCLARTRKLGNSPENL